jgi:predicted dithiol-disulfide oxidoreductase (DUF899 family)
MHINVTDFIFIFAPDLTSTCPTLQVKVSHVNGNVAYEESKETWETIYRPDDDKNPMVEFTIENLKEMTSYEVEIKARNSIGWSAVNDRFVFTTSQGQSIF